MPKEAPRAGDIFLGRGSEPAPHQLGDLEAHCNGSGTEPRESFEFGAFWDMKIASKQCNVAMKRHEKYEYGMTT